MQQGEKGERAKEHRYIRAQYVKHNFSFLFFRLYLSVWKTLLDTSKRKVVNGAGGGRKFNVKMKSRNRKYAAYEYTMCRKPRCS